MAGCHLGSERVIPRWVHIVAFGLMFVIVNLVGRSVLGWCRDYLLIHSGRLTILSVECAITGMVIALPIVVVISWLLNANDVHSLLFCCLLLGILYSVIDVLFPRWIDRYLQIVMSVPTLIQFVSYEKLLLIPYTVSMLWRCS
jgi:hypothetical protein